MAALRDATNLAGGFALLPDGEEIPIADFFKRYGACLSMYGDAQLVIAIPAYQASQELKDATKATVSGATALLVGTLIRSPNLGKIAGGAVSGYIAGDISNWLTAHLEHGRKVKIITVRDFEREMNGQFVASRIIDR